MCFSNMTLGLQLVQLIWTSKIMVVIKYNLLRFLNPMFVDTKLNTRITTCPCNISITNYMFLIYSFICSHFIWLFLILESNLTSIGIVHLISFILWIENYSNFRINQICPALSTTCYTLRWKFKLFHKTILYYDIFFMPNNWTNISYLNWWLC